MTDYPEHGQVGSGPTNATVLGHAKFTYQSWAEVPWAEGCATCERLRALPGRIGKVVDHWHRVWEAAGRETRDAMTDGDLFVRFRARLVLAEQRLTTMAETGDTAQPERVFGKAEGVRLALSYLDEETR